MFDPSLKKRSKKKQVAFTEDPLGAEADPTDNAPVPIANETTSGEKVDMSPKTAHEQMKEAEEGGVAGAVAEDAPTELKEDDEFKAMFGDLKKKKKSKKEIPLDLVCLLNICFGAGDVKLIY